MEFKMMLMQVFICYCGLLCLTVQAFGCPPRCTCNHRSVRCMRLQLTTIPDVPTDTNILDLRYNHIHEIPTDAFRGLSYLHTIFLNENQLTTIHAAAFRGLPSLKYLYLNKNRISKIAANSFKGLNRLQSLYLQFNDISEFNADTFSNMQRLERLFLYNNRISKIPIGTFTNMSSLKRLRLDSNTIQCDCSILWLLKKMKTNKQFVQAVIPCKHPPQMIGKNLYNMEESDFHCKPPYIMEEPHDVIVDFGGTAIFTCNATGDPEPDIIWMKNSEKLSLQDSRYYVQEDGTLNIKNADSSVMGQYECMAKNSLGEMKSRPARMALNMNDENGDIPQKPKIILPPSDLTVTYHDVIVLHCAVTGMPQPNIVWSLNGKPLSQLTETIHFHVNGTLIIENPSLNVSGVYKCEAVNYLGTASATVKVKVNVLPQITVMPENQTLKGGSHLLLECEAEGYPTPKIWWKRKERPLTTTNRIFFGNENTELHIEHIKLSDAGRYVCMAENAIGTSEAVADVTVEIVSKPPKFLFEPYDIDAIPGTTIELPCMGEGDPIPEVKWKKDGRTLTSSAKHHIASKGSLYIKKISELDTGRYECSIINEFGRATASGLVTVKNNEALAPGDRFVPIAFADASKDIDNAINQTITSLFAQNNAESRHHADLFKLFRYPNAPARELARAAEIYERTLVNIRKHVENGANITYDMSDFNYKDILSTEHLNLVAELSGCMAHRIIPNCTNMCFHLKYRSIDGTCNNLQHSSWGASLTGFRRILKPIYENGFSMPIGWTKGKLYYGFPKPSARLVSTSVISTKTITPDNTITHMVMQWGQFLDHDLDHAIPSVSSESWDGVDCKKTCEYAAPCYPIEVPANDPRIQNRRCIDLVRSSAICGSGMTSVLFDTIQPREQINQLTSYIDASQVYGYSVSFARDLRNLTFGEGLLRTGVQFPNQKSMLPFAAPTDGIDCRRDIGESNVNCFVAGDIRVNEQIGLVAMHTIWLREHNRIAKELKEINQHWDGETLYQEARKIVGAEMQHITYSHWLPNILGPDGMSILGKYNEYDPNINPSISNEFATAALRFGHTLINPVLHRFNETFQPIPQGHLPLHKAFFAPWRLVYEGGVDPLMRGFYTVAAKLKLPTENLNTELTEKLFLTAHAVALDLAAINIQRSRDHAIPGYNEYRKVCNLTVADTFDDLKLEISSDIVRDKLKELYGHPSNIDIFVGGILEDQVEDGRVGPLFRCILIEQFRKLRSGDRHWYENPSTFRPEQLSQIKQASLGRILCDNGDNITQITNNVFHLPEVQDGFKQCSEISKINIGMWLNCDKCSTHPDPNLPRILDPNLPTVIDPNLSRQRRNIRSKRQAITMNHILSDNSTSDLDEYENFIDMNDERIEGLESLIDNFQKTMKQIRKRIKKLEQNCPSNKFKTNGHCVDDLGNRRLNNEIWSKDVCTRCECNHQQITCTVEKCPKLLCGVNTEMVKSNGECCATCSMVETAPAA